MLLWKYNNQVGSSRRSIDEQMESSLQKSLLGEIKTRVCPSERFLDPPAPPINFIHDQISISLVLFRVRLGLDFSGPSAAARTG